MIKHCAATRLGYTQLFISLFSMLLSNEANRFHGEETNQYGFIHFIICRFVVLFSIFAFPFYELAEINCMTNNQMKEVQFLLVQIWKVYVVFIDRAHTAHTHRPMVLTWIGTIISRSIEIQLFVLTLPFLDCEQTEIGGKIKQKHREQMNLKCLSGADILKWKFEFSMDSLNVLNIRWWENFYFLLFEQNFIDSGLVSILCIIECSTEVIFNYCPIGLQFLGFWEAMNPLLYKIIVHPHKMTEYLMHINHVINKLKWIMMMCLILTIPHANVSAHSTKTAKIRHLRQ